MEQFNAGIFWEDFNLNMMATVVKISGVLHSSEV